MNGFLAKSNPPETIEEHTNKLLSAYEEFYKLYSNQFSDEELKIIRLAAQYHDFGKVSFPFQCKVKNEKIIGAVAAGEIQSFYRTQKLSEIPHGYLSPAFLDIKKLEEEYGYTPIFALINAIYYHHTRDTNYSNAEIIAVIENDIKKQVGNRYHLSTDYLGRVFEGRVSVEEWNYYAVVKGILNKLDYVASAKDNVQVEINPRQDGMLLSEIVKRKLKSLREVQFYMQGNKDKNLVVTASTGIGKTEGALLWLNGAKSFYTLPLKVSIDAIYSRIVDKYGYSKSKATLLHSDAMAYLLKNETTEEIDPFLKYEQARLFSYPMTVCTVDQLFKFVYKYLGCEIIPATLKYSKLVIDEIQAYSPEILAKIIYGLKIITELGGKFAIITATFPPVLEYFMKQEKIPYEKSAPFFSDIKNRHFIEYKKGEFDFEQILREGKTKKVLVLCNTVQKAQEVYEKLKGENNVWLLHSNFIKRHRASLENEIIKFSQKTDSTGIWISTQIVEASLDIDFDMLFTEMATADSLLQRFGRCYRKREYKGNTPNVLIYDTGNGIDTVYSREIYDLSVNFLQQYCGRIFTEEEKLDYINTVFSLDNLRNTVYYKQLKNSLNEIKRVVPTYFSKKEAESKFRDITSKMVMPEEIFLKINDDGNIDRLMKIISNKNNDYVERVIAKDKLFENTISLNEYSKKSMMADKMPICKDVEIYRVELEYDFNEDTLKGAGLTINPLNVNASNQF